MPFIIVLVAAANGLWRGDFERSADEDEAGSSHDEQLVVGLAVTRWAWSDSRWDPGGPEKYMRYLACRRSQAQDLKGFLRYPVLCAAALHCPVSTLLKSASDILRLIANEAVIEQHLAEGGTPVKDILERWHIVYGGRLSAVPVLLTPPSGFQDCNGSSMRACCRSW